MVVELTLDFVVGGRGVIADVDHVAESIRGGKGSREGAEIFWTGDCVGVDQGVFDMIY